MLHIREMGRALRGVEIVLGAKQQHLAGEITGMYRVFRHARTAGVVEFHRPADLSQAPSLIGDLPPGQRPEPCVVGNQAQTQRGAGRVDWGRHAKRCAEDDATFV